LKEMNPIMTISRREMIRMSAGAGAAFITIPGDLFPQDRPMIMKTIPSSGEQIPAVGLGTSSSFRRAAAGERDPIHEVIRHRRRPAD